MIPVIIAILLTVTGLLGVAYYSDQGLIVDAVDSVLTYERDIACNIAGDCIEFQIPVVKENKETHETIPVEYDTEEITEATYYQNGTEIPTTSYITGNIYDVSYSRTGERVSTYKETLGNEAVMQVQIGNIISIEGQIKIIDPLTGEIIEPRTAKYSMIMTCNDLTEFCNLSSITRRGTTTVAGTFLEKIATNQSTFTEGLYNVEIFARSETLDSFGDRYEVTNTLFVEMY